MISKAKILSWASKHKVLIAAMSVAGSFAGLVFSALDLQTSIQEGKVKKILGEEEE